MKQHFKQVARRIMLLFLVCFAGHLQAQTVHNLNREADQATLRSATVESIPQAFLKEAKRARAFVINPVLQRVNSVKVGDVVELQLFETQTYRAQVTKTLTDVNGNYTLMLKLPEYPMAFAYVTTDINGKSLFAASIPELNQKFTSRGNINSQSNFLIEMNEDTCVNSEEDYKEIPQGIPLNDATSDNQILRPAQNVSAACNPSGATGETDPAVITLMIVYTPAAKAWADANQNGMANTIAGAMAQTADVVSNQGNGDAINLVYSGLVNYTEHAGDQMSTDLNRLTSTSDGYMDEVHQWRKQHGADIVALFEAYDNIGGLGWLLNNSTIGSYGLAFNTIRVQQASWTTTSIHEIGHNMGMSHNAENTSGTPLFPYAYGWHWTGSDNREYGSVMSYIGNEAPYFSNPNKTYHDVATGTSTANNAKVFRQTKHIVAHYKEKLGNLPDAPANITVSNPTKNGATISWNAASNATNYWVCVYVSGSSGTYYYFTTSNTTLTLNYPGTFSECNTYYFFVQALNECGDAVTGPTMTFSTACSSSCNAPTNITVPSAGITQTAAVVNWTGSASQYRVEYKTSAASSWTVRSPNPTTGTVTLSSLTPNTAYSVRVKAICSAGSESEYSTTQNFNTLARTYTITASAGTGGSIAPSGAVSVTEGGSQNFTFTPNSDYQINQVLIDNVANEAAKTGSSYTFSNVTAAHSISVSYTPKQIAVTSVSLNKTSVSLLTGGTEQLTATVLPTNATNKAVSWSSNNTSVASVSTSGLITAVTAGTATITVTTQDGNRTATCQVTVTTNTPSGPCATPVASGTFGESNALTWTLCPNGTLTISGTGAMPNFPSASDQPWWNSVTSSIMTVVVEDGVTSIGDWTFAYRELTSVTIPSSVTSIGAYAFWNCQVTSITLPASITNIRDWAFGLCYSLTSIDVVSGNTAYSSENGVLFNKAKTELISCPAGKYGSYAVPNTVTSIRTGALCGVGTSIAIPASVTSIGINAFYWCKELTSIDVASDNVIYSSENGVLFNKAKTELIRFPCAKSGSYMIPNTVTSIGIYAFGHCNDLTSISIPSSVTNIESYAFSSCGECSRLTSIIVNWTAPLSINSNVFQNVNLANISLVVPSGTKPLYQVASVWKDFGTITEQTATVPVTGVSLNKTSLSLQVGNAEQLTSTVLPANATNKIVSWSSSNTSVASVSASGLVTAIAAGTAIIRATTDDGGFTAQCAVTVKKQSVVVDEGDPAGSNGTGTIKISLEIPSDVAFTGTFKIVLPNGMSIDINATDLVDELKTNMQLVITLENDGSWLFTITSTSLRSLMELSYQKVVNIVYKVNESVTDGSYNAVVKDLNLKFDDGTTVASSEIPVSITVDHSYTGISSSIAGEIKVYISNHTLYVDSPVNEIISVYSVSGLLLYRTGKPAGEVQIPFGNIQDGILIIRGGSGWAKKVIKN